MYTRTQYFFSLSEFPFKYHFVCLPASNIQFSGMLVAHNQINLSKEIITRTDSAFCTQFTSHSIFNFTIQLFLNITFFYLLSPETVFILTITVYNCKLPLRWCRCHLLFLKCVLFCHCFKKERKKSKTIKRFCRIFVTILLSLKVRKAYQSTKIK